MSDVNFAWLYESLHYGYYHFYVIFVCGINFYIILQYSKIKVTVEVQIAF